MKLDHNSIETLLNQSKCTRSGFCCYDQEVPGVPGYKDEIKPARSFCIHLTRAKRDESGIWHRAKCALHGTDQYPEACKIFSFPPGPNNFCFMGLHEWAKRGVKNLENIED